MNQKIHTGCGCNQCRRGRNKKLRRVFSRMVRHKHKQQLKNNGDIIDVNISIGYTG